MEEGRAGGSGGGWMMAIGRPIDGRPVALADGFEGPESWPSSRLEARKDQRAASNLLRMSARASVDLVRRKGDVVSVAAAGGVAAAVVSRPRLC